MRVPSFLRYPAGLYITSYARGRAKLGLTRTTTPPVVSVMASFIQLTGFFHVTDRPSRKIVTHTQQIATAHITEFVTGQVQSRGLAPNTAKPDRENLRRL